MEKAVAPDHHPIAVIGCLGFNFQKRVLPELVGIDPRLVMGYDVIDQRERSVPFSLVQVIDDATLGRRLEQQRPQVVLIETPDACHARHIRLALESGARLVLCDKPLSVRAKEADELVEACQLAEPDQQVFILDHYVNLELIKAMHVLAPNLIGQIHTNSNRATRIADCHRGSGSSKQW